MKYTSNGSSTQYRIVVSIKLGDFELNMSTIKTSASRFDAHQLTLSQWPISPHSSSLYVWYVHLPFQQLTKILLCSWHTC